MLATNSIDTSAADFTCCPLAEGELEIVAAAQVRTRYWLDNRRSLSVLRWCRWRPIGSTREQ